LRWNFDALIYKWIAWQLQRELRTIFGAISFNWIHMGDGDYPKVQDYIHSCRSEFENWDIT
jgi:hypothetical protein